MNSASDHSTFPSNRTPPNQTDRENLSPAQAKKRQAWHRVGHQRMNSLLKAIENLGKLANRANYNYPPEDVKAMFREIDRALSDVKRRFDGKSKEQQGFRFPSAGSS